METRKAETEKRIVVHVCRGCSRESAAYAGAMPTNWVKGPNSGEWCGRRRNGKRCLPTQAAKVRGQSAA